MNHPVLLKRAMQVWCIMAFIQAITIFMVSWSTYSEHRYRIDVCEMSPTERMKAPTACADAAMALKGGRISFFIREQLDNFHTCITMSCLEIPDRLLQNPMALLKTAALGALSSVLFWQYTTEKLFVYGENRKRVKVQRAFQKELSQIQDVD